MHEWYVQLTAAKREDLEYVSKRYQSPVLTIGAWNGECYLTSNIFQHLADHSDVHNRAQEMLRSVVGIARLQYVDLEMPEIGQMQHLNPAGQMSTLLPPIIIPSIRATRSRRGYFVNRRGDIVEHPQFPPEDRLLELTTTNQRVRDAFIYFSNVEGWWNLYKVYEVIVQDFHNQDTKLVRTGIVDSLQELQNFKRSANDPASGFGARHAIPKSPPEKRMTLEDGKIFAGEMLHRWINRLSNWNVDPARKL